MALLEGKAAQFALPAPILEADPKQPGSPPKNAKPASTYHTVPVIIPEENAQSTQNQPDSTTAANLEHSVQSQPSKWSPEPTAQVATRPTAKAIPLISPQKSGLNQEYSSNAETDPSREDQNASFRTDSGNDQSDPKLEGSHSTPISQKPSQVASATVNIGRLLPDLSEIAQQSPPFREEKEAYLNVEKTEVQQMSEESHRKAKGETSEPGSQKADMIDRLETSQSKLEENEPRSGGRKEAKEQNVRSTNGFHPARETSRESTPDVAHRKSLSARYDPLHALIYLHRTQNHTNLLFIRLIQAGTRACCMDPTLPQQTCFQIQNLQDDSLCKTDTVVQHEFVHSLDFEKLI